MHPVLIVINGLVAALLLFGLGLHDELLWEPQRKRRMANSLIVIEGGKPKWRQRVKPIAL